MRTRTLNPWGYREEISYQSEAEMFDNAFDKMYASVHYDSGDSKIHFYNVEGEEKATIDVTEFNNEGKTIRSVIYQDGNIIIIFNDGSSLSCNITEVTADVERRVSEVERAVQEMSGDTDELKDELEEEKQRSISADTAMQDDIRLLQEQSFTEAGFEYDPSSDSMSIKFYNRDSTIRDKVELFDTDDGVSARMSAGTF